MAKTLAAFLLLFVSVPLLAQLDVEAEVTAVGSDWNSTSAITQGGFGKADELALADARARFSWTPRPGLRFCLGVDGRAGGPMASDHAGVLEAWGEATRSDEAGEWRIRAGLFFLPTSQEHAPALWSPRQSIYPSFLNSWVGEELRPIGVDLQRKVPLEWVDAYAGGTVFVGNDTMGTSLAWRGWYASPTVLHLSEKLDLPDLTTLPEHFPAQGRSLSPIGDELDGRLSVAARAGFDGEKGHFRVTWVDNRGDRELHGDQYSWATSFAHLGATIDLGRFSISAEHISGRTGMGDRDKTHVDANFDSTYVAVNVNPNGRLSAGVRVEEFAVNDNDRSAAERNEEAGEALTLWTTVRLRDHLEAIAEWSTVDATNEMALVSGYGRQVGGERITLGARSRF